MKKLSRAACALACLALLSCLPVMATAQHTGQAEELVKKGDELYKAGKFKEAIDSYKEALNIDPNNDQAIGYIGYSYNKLGDKESARQWMKRRVDIPGQTASKKATTLADLALLYWDEAHVKVVSLLAAGVAEVNAQDKAATQKMIAEGIDSAQKAVTIAPRSVKGFNLLNLLYRSSAAMQADPAARKELMGKADEALRQAIKFYDSNPQAQQSVDMFMTPTISTLDGSDLGEAVKMGQATKKVQPDSIKEGKGAVAIEVLVGRDGKPRFHRVLAGQGKVGDAALAAARQWTFEPTTFEGTPVQLFSVINFTVK